MKTIDKDVLARYNEGREFGRLRSGLGLIEFERTRELLLTHLPPAPAVIYDIGGGYGEYAWWLASLDYEVHLFDLSETNIHISADLAQEYPGTSLACAMVCDARSIPRSDDSADALLLMGPLYHITQRDERLDALCECRRLLKHGAPLFAAAITPYAPLLARTTTYGVHDRWLENPDFIAMVERELRDGQHSNRGCYQRGIGDSYFHTSAALREELHIGGFTNAAVYGVVGAAWLAPNLDELWADPFSREALMHTVRLLDGHDEIIGLSTHILGVAIKP